MNSDQIRHTFLRFFEQKGHGIVPSSSLIPLGDPTLLLTSAGMVQFKPYFTGEATPPSPRLASCQKCFRVTDVDEVGDSRHLTFFEMLGNFSVGDYFKQESIDWAWEFVTRTLELPVERLWITIFFDDDEAFRCWRDLGVPEDRIWRFGEEDNFWGPAGDTGPCGPCSEIHYDLGEAVGCGRAQCGPNCECGRFSEIWNLVFTQYDQQEDGTRIPLPKPNIDTGMGLERTAAAMQGKATVYETDLFIPIMGCAERLAHRKYGEDEPTDRALRIMAEHARAITFLLADGVMPSNEGRGYVLRRVLRRAVLFGRKLGLHEPFLSELARVTISHMQHHYPELKSERQFILSTIDAEESRFDQTIDVGIGILEHTIVQLRRELLQYLPRFESAFRDATSGRDYPALRDAVRKAVEDFLRDCPGWWHVLGVGGRDAIAEAVEPAQAALGDLHRLVTNYQGSRPGAFDQLKNDLAEQFRQAEAAVHEVAVQISGFETFVLYDTYGFPKEITAEIAAENGLTLDLDGFEAEMQRQRERARAAQRVAVGEGAVDISGALDVHQHHKTEFVGYDRMESKSSILTVIVDGTPVAKADEEQDVEVILEETPFYGEMGGQAGDTGEIRGRKGRIEVSDTVRHTVSGRELIVHHGKVVEGSISVNDTVTATVDKQRRLDIARNHTATHLLQAALRQVLGEHVRQSGSVVAPHHLTFDFSSPAALTREQLSQVQRTVNERIRQNLAVRDRTMSYQQAREAGALAFFEEKYGDEVRVLVIGRPPISMELCGGTHVKRTGDIGYFQIVGESSIGAGLRRIEAVTGRGAEEFIEKRFAIMEHVAEDLKAPVAEVESRIASLQQEMDAQRKKAVELERRLLTSDLDSLLSKAESVDGITVLAARVPASDVEGLRQIGDAVKERLSSAVVVLGADYNGRANFVAMLTPDLVRRGLHAGDIVKRVAAVAGGGGGGKAETGQAGGKDAGKLDDALKLTADLVREHGNTRT